MDGFSSIAALAMLAGLDDFAAGSGSFLTNEREYVPPARPKSKRQALALEKALRRKDRQTGDPS